MSYELKGTVKEVMDQQTFDSGFTKREFVVQTNERYPQDIKMECVKDKVSMLNGIERGMDVAVDFDLRGNEYNGRYYVNLVAWRVQHDIGAVSVPTHDDGRPVGEDPTDYSNDDIPF